MGLAFNLSPRGAQADPYCAPWPGTFVLTRGVEPPRQRCRREADLLQPGDLAAGARTVWRKVLGLQLPSRRKRLFNLLRDVAQPFLGALRTIYVPLHLRFKF